jgi:hypothetical protein
MNVLVACGEAVFLKTARRGNPPFHGFESHAPPLSLEDWGLTCEDA